MKVRLLNTIGLVAALVAWQYASAQVHCDGLRYIQPVFEQVDSTIGVPFGHNTTVAGDQDTLRMDVYYPDQEFFFARPVVIVAFGGSFITGSRNQLRQLCILLARRGYVAATVDYRLFDAFGLEIDSALAFDVAVKATADLKAAIRWFREDAAHSNEFGIDSNLIFIGGVSSGAIAALHVAYLDTADYSTHPTFDSIVQANGGIRGNSSDNFHYADGVKGVLNFSGALKDARWIDAGEPPVFSAHDEFDDVVPYDRNISNAIGTPIELWGSAEIHSEAVSKGLRSQLVTINNSTGHVSYLMDTNGANYQRVIDSAALFLEYIICDRVSAVREKVRNSPGLQVYPNPTASLLHLPPTVSEVQLWSLSGQMLLSTTLLSHSQVDVSPLAHGHYIMMLKSADGTWTRSAFVKH